MRTERSCIKHIRYEAVYANFNAVMHMRLCLIIDILAVGWEQKFPSWTHICAKKFSAFII
jgi:hypothetical protein